MKIKKGTPFWCPFLAQEEGFILEFFEGTELVFFFMPRKILRYVQRKYIYAVNIMGKHYISKQSIINYLATDKAFKNTQKSEWHECVIKQFMENI